MAELTIDDGLEWIPREVRTRLDVAGMRLHLREWQALPLDERRALCAAPFSSDEDRRRWGERLKALVFAHCGTAVEPLGSSPSSK